MEAKNNVTNKKNRILIGDLIICKIYEQQKAKTLKKKGVPFKILTKR